MLCGVSLKANRTLVPKSGYFSPGHPVDPPQLVIHVMRIWDMASKFCFHVCAQESLFKG